MAFIVKVTGYRAPNEHTHNSCVGLSLPQIKTCLYLFCTFTKMDESNGGLTFGFFTKLLR